VTLAEALPRVVVEPPGPRSRELAARLRAVESRNVTFLAPDFPVFWSEAAGAMVRDADDNLYLDLTGAFGVSLAGHAHPAVVAAVREQAGRLVHGMGDVHPPEVKLLLLERLAHLAPLEDARAVLATSGSEAIEIALKTAELATGRSRFVAFEGGYHGLTLGSLATTHRLDFRAPFAARLHRGVTWVPWPRVAEGGREEGASGADTAHAIETFARALADGPPVAGVLFEPVQGRAGVRLPPQGFLPEVARLAREAGALVIADEVFTGFGRTGALFASAAEGVVPDVLCVGKALGGGLPLSACVAPADVMDAWPPSQGEALHTSTFLGHPLACAAALAFLDVLEREDLPARARALGARLLEGLADRLRGVAAVRDVRGRGLLLGIELGEGGAARVAVEALRRGVLVLPAGERGEVVELAPPALLNDAQVEAGLDGVAAAVRAVHGAA